MNTNEQIEGKVLGKQISHPKQYAPEILVAVPRHLNRSTYHIEESKLPFVGYDSWHAYELSFLTEKGLPVSGILKLVYPCNNPFLVESKSLKLYLNSFNMGKYGNTPKEGISTVLSVIQNDLNDLLQTDVKVSFHSEYAQNYDFDAYTLLEEREGVEHINFDVYKEEPAFLIGEKQDSVQEYKVASRLLRSNCKITHQPDWGNVYIHIKSEYELDLDALLQYIVSVRDENHFHEEICEMIYKRLLDKFNPEELMVVCIYTRRGGIDICPVRANKPELLPLALSKAKVLTKADFRQ